MPECLAYFLTWTTYGTWLHGDDRGSVDDRQNHVGTPVIEPNFKIRARATSRLSEKPFVLDESSRRVVGMAIERVAERRGWIIHALNVRSNHVHVVVSAPTHTPEVVAGQLKSWATRTLREQDLINGQERVWTKQASTRWINTQASLIAAVDYVKNRQ